MFWKLYLWFNNLKWYLYVYPKYLYTDSECKTIYYIWMTIQHAIWQVCNYYLNYFWVNMRNSMYVNIWYCDFDIECLEIILDICDEYYYIYTMASMYLYDIVIWICMNWKWYLTIWNYYIIWILLIVVFFEMKIVCRIK